MYLCANNIYYIIPIVSKTEKSSNYYNFDTLPQFEDIMLKSKIQSFLPKEIPEDAEYEYWYSPGYEALEIRVKFKPQSVEALDSIENAKLSITKECFENGNHYFYGSSYPDSYKHICIYDNGDIEYLLLVRIASPTACSKDDFYCPEETII